MADSHKPMAALRLVHALVRWCRVGCAWTAGGRRDAPRGPDGRPRNARPAQSPVGPPAGPDLRRGSDPAGTPDRTGGAGWRSEAASAVAEEHTPPAGGHSDNLKRDASLALRLGCLSQPPNVTHKLQGRGSLGKADLGKVVCAWSGTIRWPRPDSFMR